MAERKALEMLQVLRQAPRQLAIHADHAVARDRRNEIDARTRSVYASPGL